MKVYIYDMATLRLQTVFCPVQKVSWDDKLNLFDISVSYEIFLTLCCVLCTLLALSRGVLLCWPLMGITWSDHGLWILSGVFSICLVSVWWFRFCLYDNCACQWTTAVWLDVGSLRFGVINLVFELPQSKPKQWTHLSTLHNYNLGLITVYDLCSICQSWHPSFETMVARFRASTAAQKGNAALIQDIPHLGPYFPLCLAFICFCLGVSFTFWYLLNFE